MRSVVASQGAASLLVVLAICAFAGGFARADDPFLDEIVSFTPGTQAGFGQGEIPEIVLGPPEGAGDLQGSFDVLALGNGGEIVVRFAESVICDGVGVDFTVFENAFHAGSVTGPLFAEVGIVAVSQDDETYFAFPYDAAALTGFAGLSPVYSRSDNGIDPTDSTVSGGDTFDLADVGLPWAAYVRITDPGASIADPGNIVPPGDSAGFDLDAMALVNGCPASSSTTTSTSSTTLPSEPRCGDPDDTGSYTASDALFILRAAIGAVACSACVCDVDNSGGTSGPTASDALRLLRFAVGVGGVVIECPACTGEFVIR